ncbi:uncharacterized protein RHOBADRAFT_56535, partial [Rhodotorula graminis WP1]
STRHAQHARRSRPSDCPPLPDHRLEPHRRRSRPALDASSSRTGPLPGWRAERRRGRGRHVEEERGRAHVHRGRSRNRRLHRLLANELAPAGARGEEGRQARPADRERPGRLQAQGRHARLSAARRPFVGPPTCTARA